MHCVQCGQDVDVINYSVITYFVGNQDVINIDGEEIEVPTEAQYIDIYYCSCTRFIKSKFRIN